LARSWGQKKRSNQKEAATKLHHGVSNISVSPKKQKSGGRERKDMEGVVQLWQRPKRMTNRIDKNLSAKGADRGERGVVGNRHCPLAAGKKDLERARFRTATIRPSTTRGRGKRTRKPPQGKVKSGKNESSTCAWFLKNN